MKHLLFFSVKMLKKKLYDASHFSPFQFIRTNENGLSEIIAFLLDPSQNHGQQDLFLNSLLKYLNLPEYLSYNNVSVTCEKVTSERGRHDIFIEGFLDNKRQWIISIENKLRYAADQNNQLEDYWENITSYNPNFCCLIYLSPFKKPPSEQSIDTDRWNKLIQDNQAKVIGVEDLIKWLEQTAIIAPNIRAFCQSFIQFLKEDIMNETKENNQLLDKLVENPDWIEAATTLLDLSDNIYKKLEDSLVQQLQNKLKEEYPRMIKYNWHFYNVHKEGIFLDKEDKKYSWSIGIANDNKKYHNVYYGFWANKDNISQENYQRLEEMFKLEGFEQAKWWIQWQYCNGNLRNWDGKTWKDVITGHLAKQIFELLEPFIKIANKHLEELETFVNK
ncbi:PD-(D/E)XK nuclease family protein [Avibacterium sp. 20-15]|uniref:PD-(D/E)XK nuclease family protein n=1 Tax=unclassified Avibacterium TaxID=2685287 RepID=UPI00202603F3|nr:MULTISPECIES: PD-(D/E)XK nuclease family protein [unclassified Avibacterium]MCW9733923.1 PD-(D/E)XK nuclease family protein [Avibacterium sp. 20-15]URL03920.1 PD-(D/E)XK nuclease family protein [Avibacterium sp. 20-132]